MTDFYVDLDALKQMAANLATIYDALDHAGDDFSYAEPDLGSSDVSGSLNSFCSGWKDGRKTIKDEIKSLIDAVRGAAEDYEHNENEIRKSSTNAGISTTTQAR
ncbi:MAG: hypothetical protein ABI140_07845 [Jatrophihabitantaceae bacterium]